MNRQPITATMYKDHVLADNDKARTLHAKSGFGTTHRKKIKLTFVEALYLLEQKKVAVFKQNKQLTFEQLVRAGQRQDKQFWQHYIVYNDLRDRGYVVKTGLKYGTQYRVYAKGAQHSKDHAKWIVTIASEHDKITMQDFAGKARIAHSTRKTLLTAITDDEDNVTYYEVEWVRP